jgi:hypothetical protein
MVDVGNDREVTNIFTVILRHSRQDTISRINGQVVSKLPILAYNKGMDINRKIALQNLKLLLDHPLQELSVNEKGMLYLSKKKQELVLYVINRTLAFATKMEPLDRLFVPTGEGNLYASAGHVFKKVHQFLPASDYALEEKVEERATLKFSYAGKEYVGDKENFIHKSSVIKHLLEDLEWTEKDEPIPLDDVFKLLNPTKMQLKTFLKLFQDETEDPVFSREDVLVYIKMAHALDVPFIIERLIPPLYIWLDQDTLLDLIDHNDLLAITLLSKLPHRRLMELLLRKPFGGVPQPKRARIIPVSFIINCINRNRIPLSMVICYCPIPNFFTLLGEAAQGLKYIELNSSDATSLNLDLVLTHCPNVTTLIIRMATHLNIDRLERVGSLQHLRHLEIKGTKDSSLDANCLKSCGQLKKLSLTSLTLAESSLGVIVALPYLEELHCKLKKFLPITLSQIASKTSLRSLTLHDLEMDQNFLERLTPLINLEVLSLSNQTPRSGLAPLAKMTRLRELSLLFIETQMDSLPKLPSLRVLRISSNHCITSLNFLEGREQLHELSLGCLSSLPAEAVQGIRNLKKITSLSLERLPLHNEHLSFLIELLELETLSLIDLHGIDAGITPILFTLPNLKRVKYKGEVPLKLSFVQVEEANPFQDYTE